MIKQQCIKESVKFESQGRFHEESDSLAGLTNRNDGSYGFYHITSFTDLLWLGVSDGVGCDFVSLDQCQVPGSRNLFYVCISPSPPRLPTTSETITATQFSLAYQLPQHSPAVVQAKR